MSVRVNVHVESRGLALTLDTALELLFRDVHIADRRESS